MLWGHSLQYCSNDSFDFFENIAFKFIYSFHMPLFMLVSGYLFFFSSKKRNLSKLLIHRSQSLLQPIVFCTFINYFLTEVISKHKITLLLNGAWLWEMGGLWFLWSVLASSVFVAIAEKTTKNDFLRIIILAFGFAAVTLFPNWEMNVYMYPYFVIGYYFSKHKEQISANLLKLKYIVLLIFPILLVYYEKKHYIYTTGIISSDNAVELLYIDAYRWAIGLFGSIFMLVLIGLFYKIIRTKMPSILNPVSKLGIKSLQVYCLSVSLLSFWLPEMYNKFCDIIGKNILASNMFLYNFLFTPIIAIAYSIAIYYIVKLFDRTKISKVIFGR